MRKFNLITILILAVVAMLQGCTKNETLGLRIVDENGKDISVLDFGDENTDVSRLFSIVNDSESVLSWQITFTADWIDTVSKMSGVLPEGGTQGVVVLINRDALPQGESTATMYITSNIGNKQLTIKAIGGVVSTLPASSITAHSAILHGKIQRDIPYTEKGFVYGTNDNMNTWITIAVDGNGVGEFSAEVLNLDATTTYHYRAYCVLDGTTYYGVEKTFGPYYTNVPCFKYMGQTYMVAPDPGYELNWSEANGYCNGLTMYGYSDWRLPTKMELQQMYYDRNSIGGFVESSNNDVFYWSSSLYYNNYYYVIEFNAYGSVGAVPDDYHHTGRVRPIRKK